MPIRHPRLVLLAAAWCALPGLAHADDLPTLDPTRALYCTTDEHDRRLRIQCDEATKRCLVAFDGETNSTGEIIRPLERATYCPPNVDEAAKPAALTARGYKMIPAIADAPFGWMRDELGRVFQVNFDLTRRLYLGASYQPSRIAGVSEWSRMAFDFGVLVFESWGGPSDPTRYRLRLAEGQVAVAPFAADLTLFHLDLSRRFENPLLRITTFFGKPRRRDAMLNVGLWFDGGGFEARSTTAGDTRLWHLGTAQLTLDLWQSATLESFVRLRGGGGFEQAHSDGLPDRSAITPSVAAEARFALDDAGFYHVGGEVSAERPQPFETGAAPLHRLKAEVDYEMILIAINDQPLSLHLATGAEKRDDLPGVADRWAFTANAGLRFSLWAPPRAR